MTQGNKGVEFLGMLQKILRATRPTEDLPFSPGEFVLMDEVLSSDNSSAGIKINDIAKSTGMSKPSMSRMLNSLEKKGYVKRQIHSEDRRVVCVKLTSRGKKALQQTKQKFTTFITDVFEEMGSEDSETLLLLLENLYSIMQQHSDRLSQGSNTPTQNPI